MNPKPLLALNHFTVPCSLLTALLFSGPLRGRTTLSYLMPQVPSPSTELRPSSSFVLPARKAGGQNKKGRKCDLATALQTQRRYKSNKRKYRVTRFSCFSKWFLLGRGTRHGGRARRGSGGGAIALTCFASPGRDPPVLQCQSTLAREVKHFGVGHFAVLHPAPLLREVSVVLQRNDQLSHVARGGAVQICRAHEIKRELLRGGRDRRGLHLRLVPGIAVVRHREAVAIRGVHRHHLDIPHRMKAFHQRRAVRSDLIFHVNGLSLSIEAFPFAGQGLQLLEAWVGPGFRHLLRKNHRGRRGQQNCHAGNGKACKLAIHSVLPFQSIKF